ncbi:MAG: serine/threonine-protein kinase [Kofleriaceae bacterium]
MRPGEVIDGKYRIEVRLGEGGMGRVLAASHLAIGSTVAIKVLKSSALSYPEVPKRFMREARAAGRLRSEHVVRVMDVGQLKSGEPYMVMEMLHGSDLASHLANGPIPPALAVEYIVQACEGLAEAHALGMVHRDIKPANLFVTKRSNGAPLIKLLDFGIATAAIGDVDHGLTTTQSVIGSPSYMSPEQLRAARDVDQRSDIWSLGVTLYELLSMRQPFVAPTLTALSLMIVSDPHPPLLHIEPALREVIDRCLAKEREDRYQTVAELAQALAPLFPGGHAAAELVTGALRQAVAPTLLGTGPIHALDGQWTGAAGSEARLPPGLGANTTGMVAGQSEPSVSTSRRKWIAIGLASTVAVAAVGLLAVTSLRNDDGAVTPSTLPAPAQVAPLETNPTPPPPAPAAASPAPLPSPAVATPPVATQDMSREPAESAGAARGSAIEPDAKPTLVPPKPKRARPKDKSKDTDRRGPVEPGEYKGSGAPPAPVKPAPPPPPEPKPADAKPAPCLPSDPGCGL